ncbi:MAG: DUF1571 domain-containing protein [Fuerstiella sp.]
MNAQIFKFASLFAMSVLSASVFAQERPAQAKEHPLVPAIRFTETCLGRVEAFPGYEATFYKREIIGRSVVNQKMKLKIRHSPFSVYLYFQEPSAGREVLYVEGKNNGKLIAHESGLLSLAGSMELSPTDPMALKESRYPITEAGIAKAIRQLLVEWKRETKYGETDVKYYKDAKLGSMTCRVIESSHPQPRKQFTYHKVQLWINDADGIPVRIRKYGFPARAGQEAPIIEDYTFTDINTSVRLTDVDFDRNNSKYSF